MATPVVAKGYIYEEGPYGLLGSGVINVGHAVKYTANVDEVEECDTAGEASYGIAIEDGADAEHLSILRRGKFDGAIAGAALATPDTELQVNAAGRYIAALTGDVVVGWNRTTTAADGDPFQIELDTAQRLVP